MHLFGRRSERETVDEILADARAGRSGALVVLGEAGIGKTALLDHAADVAARAGFTVVRVVGNASEQQLAFAGLHQLCAPLLEHVDALPDPQRGALDVALGRGSGPPPDLFLVGLATLSLLSESAEQRPLLCLVDDAALLDAASTQVVAFVVRRLAADRLALIVASRELTDERGSYLAGIRSVSLTGLGDADARALLESTVSTPIEDVLRDRVVAEARGNPLALLELPRATSATQLAGGLAVPVTAPRRVEEAYRERYAGLPQDTRHLLLIATAEPTGDPALLWAAASHLGIRPDAAAAAEEAGLLEIGTTVRFPHPLARSAIYGVARPADRRRVHDVLARALDARTDPDRRAWHRANAILGTDEEVAVESVAAAERAIARGGFADAAALLERATELTPDPRARAGRALLAAQAMHEAGAPDEATRLLAVAEAGTLDDLERARVRLYRAMIDFDTTSGDGAPARLVDAAKMLAPLDPTRSREAFLVALNSAVVLGAAPGRMGVQEVASAAEHAPAPLGPPEPADLLLDALVSAYTRGLADAVPEIGRAVVTFRRYDPSGEGPLHERTGRWLVLAARTAGAVLDDETTHSLLCRNVERVRGSGSLTALPPALVHLACVLVLTGDFARSADLAAESRAVARATGVVPLASADLLLSAWRGQEDDVVRLSATSVADDAGAAGGVAQYALAVSRNASGDYAGAADAALRASRSPELFVRSLALHELVEGAVRGGRRSDASSASHELTALSSACGTPLARGLAAQARALLVDDDAADADAAEDHYREAIDQLGATRMAAHLARAHLLHGEWLRRRGLRQAAREQLRIAHESFVAMGAEAFAERAARELRATGEHPRAHGVGASTALTDHERHIARLVAAGATSREVAAGLFLSPRTIETHLRNIYRKLGITSRRQLRELL
ncbi:LuxR family transcriptional regulator [Isoptericola halotolerans]|uniref:DNA-binding CsgD family transcriptional regulator n=1 Tax=Isoptericola halotolerans TaxID=300560 RepID=A0ABX2A2M9_9MICO|nr:DNA-binding CsgD family transcriptional regulator [Isoptericola halotolerans]